MKGAVDVKVKYGNQEEDLSLTIVEGMALLSWGEIGCNASGWTGLHLTTSLRITVVS